MSKSNTPATNAAAARPGEIIWKPKQLEAITTRLGDTVVSASAGSGKTAVLTERVLRLIAERDGGAGLERMLIITFTEKATRQMRERIEGRLRAALDTEPESAALRGALDALPEAWIMTIDAFCRRIVVANFHRLGIPPAAHIPDAADYARMERRALDDLLERTARESGERRAMLETLLRAEGGAPALAGQLRHMLRFLESLDQPEAWLRRQREQLRVAEAAESYEQLPEAFAAAGAFKRATAELAAHLGEVVEMAAAAGGDAGPVARMGELRFELAELASEAGAPFRPDEVQAWLAEHEPFLAKLVNKGVCGGALYNDKAFLKQIAEPFCAHFKHWRGLWFALDEATLWRGARLAAQRGLAMLELAEQAGEALRLQKRRRGWVTFSDFARLALELLSDGETGGPSEVAAELQARFHHVLVDEYQDTSPLQDAIICRVSRTLDPDADVAGNLFVVGDIKQSIYRFRHAEPALFAAKIDTAETGRDAHGKPCVRISLLENFRSRPAILQFVNACFARLMDRELGDVAYDAREHLVAGREEAEGGGIAVEAHWLPTRVDAAGAGDDDDAEGREGRGDGGGEGGQDEMFGEAGRRETGETLEGIEAQAAWIAQRIGAMTSGEGAEFEPGDCAILLRGLRNELETWVTALEREGLRVRAPGVNPLFASMELIDLLNALRVADNPLQDHALAGVMRSPLGGFNEDELLRLRMQQPGRAAFHEAVWSAAGRDPEGTRRGGHDDDAAAGSHADLMTAGLREKLGAFMARVDRWRGLARLRTADELLDAIVLETRYEAWLMARPDALVRLERLDFLRGLLRRLGNGSEGADSLSQVLDLIEQAREDGGDIGELPETVAAQRDAVNVLTIHKSKGLEFPVVFVPRLERRFRDKLQGDLLFDLQGGMAMRGVDVEARLRYATLAWRMLGETRRRKERSEELRLLYVAMTRAEERLVLVGQVRDPHAKRETWALRGAGAGAGRGGEVAPARVFDRLHAASPAELLGPIIEGLAPHAVWLAVHDEPMLPVAGTRAPLGETHPELLRALAQTGPDPQADWDAAIARLERDAGDAAEGEDVVAEDEAAGRIRLLPTHDPRAELTWLPAKTTVTQLRLEQAARDAAEEQAAEDDEPESARGGAGPDTPYEIAREQSISDEPAADAAPWMHPNAEKLAKGESMGRIATRRPKFAPATAREKLDASRRGTLIHSILAQVELAGELTEAGLRVQAARLYAAGRLSEPAPREGVAEAGGLLLGQLNFAPLAWFFGEEAGRLMAAEPARVMRELPFTRRRALDDRAPEIAAAYPNEFLLLQGMVDVVIDEGDTAQVLDYKTDRVRGAAHADELEERYRFQLEQYGRALKLIWKLRRVEAGLVLLDGREIRWMTI